MNRDQMMRAMETIADEKRITVEIRCFCKDCVWRTENGACNNFGGFYMKPDEFCSQAVRRSNK